MKKKIAILFHENGAKSTSHYLISYFADIWRKKGNEVTFLVGTKKFVPADLIIVHVDLSVVPDKYLEFAKQYPIVLNGEVKDIRKSTFSKNLVGIDDPYEGKVIVKSNLNFAGHPERRLNKLCFARFRTGAALKLFSPPFPFKSKLDYKIYDHPSLIPRAYFKNPNVLVEKFLPEKEEALYFSRTFYFLGDRTSCVRISSKNPIVESENHIGLEIVEPHPKIIEYRKALKFDYGNFDYQIHHGEVVLVDTNKTTGMGTATYALKVKQFHSDQAGGIYSYFNDTDPSNSFGNW